MLFKEKVEIMSDLFSILLLFICLPLIYIVIGYFFSGIAYLFEGVEKAAEKTHTGGCLSFFLFLLGFGLLIATAIGSLKSCDSKSPTYDYYDSPRK